MMKNLVRMMIVFCLALLSVPASADHLGEELVAARTAAAVARNEAAAARSVYNTAADALRTSTLAIDTPEYEALLDAFLDAEAAVKVAEDVRVAAEAEEASIAAQVEEEMRQNLELRRQQLEQASRAE